MSVLRIVFAGNILDTQTYPSIFTSKAWIIFYSLDFKKRCYRYLIIIACFVRVNKYFFPAKQSLYNQAHALFV